VWKKDDAKPQSAPEKAATPAIPAAVVTPPVASTATAASRQQPPSISPSPTPANTAARGSASIGQGIRIKGEVTGSEDLYVDGLVDGQLNLTNGALTIGPNGQIKADVNAREVIVRGRIDGKVTGRDKVQLMGTAQVTGEVQTDRLAIEEGALLRGKVEAGKQTAKAPAARTAAAGAGAEASSASESAAD
jgi:cytoskeletal protein CcmA (bactofilin family)